jgi:hypothetical protein
MTEAEWLEHATASDLLNDTYGMFSERKLRLFSCGCCFRIRHLLKADGLQDAVDISTRFADGLASLGELTARNEQASAWFRDFKQNRRDTAHQRKIHAAGIALLNCTMPPRGNTEEGPAYHSNAWDCAFWAYRALPKRAEHEVVGLLRHIMGNPYGRVNVPAGLPTAVTHLAESLYSGTDCSFALHDALLEAGHPELAEHFAKEQWHPKGCWVLDVMLGKK